ncbi:hypothetical protein DND90_21370 [Pseudomonas syringae pv. maculicola]|nr:hypothetical protein DND90_21370 [Pseudomonas syringae pv. maculicola]
MKLLAESSESARLEADSANKKLSQQLAEVSNERDLLRAAAIETLRVARIANQGSRAYRRVFEDLEKAVEVKS